jgi:hypothetical protein
MGTMPQEKSFISLISLLTQCIARANKAALRGKIKAKYEEGVGFSFNL